MRECEASVSVSYQAIDAHKLLWALGPRWQLHIRNHGAVLHHSQVVIVGVDKHLGEVVELWDQLLHGQSRGTSRLTNWLIITTNMPKTEILNINRVAILKGPL